MFEVTVSGLFATENAMATNIDSKRSKVKYRKQGSNIIFAVEGDVREYTISLASPEQVVTVGPDLNELIWAIERAWRNKT